MRRMIEFPCAGDTLVGTLDDAPGTTGVLIVSGGNEIRIGAHRGMAMLAQRLATDGVPVFRYDRRGIGDSTGENGGFETSLDDLTAAAATFRNEAPQVAHVVAFGNCDAATSLALFHSEAGIDSLLLSNPWIGEEEDDLPPAAAIEAHYAEKIKQPSQWLRLFTGKVNIFKLFGGLFKIFKSKSKVEAPIEEAVVEDVTQAGAPGHRLTSPIAQSLAASSVPATILLAERDNTAIAFRDAWQKLADAPAVPIASLDSPSHSYAAASDKEWLYARVLEAARAV